MGQPYDQEGQSGLCSFLRNLIAVDETLALRGWETTTPGGVPQPFKAPGGGELNWVVKSIGTGMVNKLPDMSTAESGAGAGIGVAVCGGGVLKHDPDPGP